MEFIVLVGVAMVLGVILGFIAFVRSFSLQSDISHLQSEIASLKNTLSLKSFTEASSVDESRVATRQTATQPDIEDQPKTTSSTATGPTEKTIEESNLYFPETPQIIETPVDDTVVGRERPTKGLEESLAGNWLIWIGGTALFLGGIFLVKAAADAGFFGPTARILAACFAGVCMIAASQWVKNKLSTQDNPHSSNLASPVLAGAGASTIFGAIYAAYGIYSLIPPFLAFVLLMSASAGMVILAVIHRSRIMAAIALVGAHLSPILASTGEPATTLFLLYIFAVSAGGLAVGRIMQWNTIAYLALAGGLFWPTILIIGGTANDTVTFAIYLPAFMLLAALIAADVANQPVDLANFLKKTTGSLSPSLLVFYIAVAYSLILALYLALAVGLYMPTANMFLCVIIGALGLAVWRDGFILTPALTIIPVALAIAFAPLGVQYSLHIWATIVAGIYGICGICGYFAMERHSEKGTFATITAFGPAAVLGALFYAVGEFNQALEWGAVALALTAVNIAALERLRISHSDLANVPGASAAFALGAILTATMAISMSADGLTMSTCIALQVPVIAWLWRRFDVPALKFSAIVIGSLATIRLFFLPEILLENVGSLPLFNWLVPAYLLTGIGFFIAARWFEGGNIARTSLVVQSLEGGGIALLTAFISLQIRHSLNDGNLNADFNNLLEISLHTISWVSLATFMRWRFGTKLANVRVFAERILLILAASLTIIGPLTVLNPWWGIFPKIVFGPPVINGLLIFYLAPAITFAISAFVTRRLELIQQSHLSGLFAGLLGYIWMILAIRHLFHAPKMYIGSISDFESWSYSLATITFATVILFFGAFHRSKVFRYAGLGMLMLAIIKVFIFDMSGLVGVWRATSFLGLGASLVGIAVLYQKVFLQMIKSENTETIQ